MTETKSPGSSLVSVITACRNQVRFIETNLKSVRNQTYAGVEHIVVDACSDDGTIDVLKKYEDVYRLDWVTEPDRGLSHAFNKGIMRSSGDILCFLNADDFFLHELIVEQVVAIMDRHQGDAIFMGGVRLVDQEGRFIRDKLPASRSPLTLRNLLYEGAPVIHQGTFYRRGVFEEVGLYSERYHTHMDYEFHLRASRRFEVVCMNMLVAGFRVHPGALSQRVHWRHHLEMIGARQANGGKLIHSANVESLRGFLLAWPITHWPYRVAHRLWRGAHSLPRR